MSTVNQPCLWLVAAGRHLVQEQAHDSPLTFDTTRADFLSFHQPISMTEINLTYIFYTLRMFSLRVLSSWSYLVAALKTRGVEHGTTDLLFAVLFYTLDKDRKT